MNTEVMFSSASVNWSTPQWFFDQYNQQYNFTLDVCALPENAKCLEYFTPDDNGLNQTWEGTVWMNPPYGRTIKGWIEKAFQEANCTKSTVVSLLPARTDTKWFHENIYNKCGVEVEFIKGRLKFGDAKNSAPFPSMVVAIKNIPAARVKELSNIALELGLQVKRVPPISSWVNGELTAKQIRPISLEELLGRDPINLSYETLNGFIKGKTVLITGAAGSIGSELVRQVMRQEPKLLIALDQAETPTYHLDLELRQFPNYANVKPTIASVTDAERMAQIFSTYKPEVVFHAAAYKHVPLMEDHPQEAVKTNILGTHTTAKLAYEHGAECFVMVSTDKAVNPTNIMGASKRAAEHVVSYFNRQPGNRTRFVTTRFGNVLGSNGSVIPLFKKQLEEGGPITLTHKDITRYFMTIPEAVRLVLEAGHMGQGGELYVFDMGEPVKIYDLAVNLIKLSGLTPGKDIEILETGLRPGEKLYEELLADGERTKPTHHEKIFIAQTTNLEFESVERMVENSRNQNLKWLGDVLEYQPLPD